MCKELKNPALKGMSLIVNYDNGCTLYTFNRLMNQSFSIEKRLLNHINATLSHNISHSRVDILERYK